MLKVLSRVTAREQWVHLRTMGYHITMVYHISDCYGTNQALILDRFQEEPIESVYNIPMFPSIRIWGIGQTLQGIYDRQGQAFKINLAFGFIMRHVAMGQYGYFIPFDNVSTFETPILI